MQIVILVFAILMIAGVWAGWRRSPLYSHKITLKLAAAFLLTVAAIAGGTAATFNGTVHLPPTAQAILIGLLVVSVGVGATAGIVRITDSHIAQVPASVRIVTSERHKIQRWIWRIVAYLLISGVIILLIPSWSWLPGVPALLLLLGGGPSLVALYMRARRLDLGMSQVQAAPWARWQYSPEQWQAWARYQLELERSKAKIDWKGQGRKTLKAVVWMVLAFLAGAWLTVSGSAADKLTAAGTCMGFLAVVVLVVYLATRGAPERHYRRVLAAPPEAMFGDEGLYCDGQFTPWILSGAYLLEAIAPHDLPARVEFLFQNFNGSSSTVVARRVPVPEGRDADVATLQLKLHARCPKAAVRLR